MVRVVRLVSLVGVLKMVRVVMEVNCVKVQMTNWSLGNVAWCGVMWSGLVCKDSQDELKHMVAASWWYYLKTCANNLEKMTPSHQNSNCFHTWQYSHLMDIINYKFSIIFVFGVYS